MAVYVNVVAVLKDESAFFLPSILPVSPAENYAATTMLHNIASPVALIRQRIIFLLLLESFKYLPYTFHSGGAFLLP